MSDNKGTAPLQAIIIGAGIAGLTCATRLADAGVSLMVLEKGKDAKYPCNTRIAGGAFHVAHRDVAEDPQVILDAIRTRTDSQVDPELIGALAGGVNEAVQWLRTCGARFIKVGHEVFRRHTLAPPIKISGKDYWHGRGGDALLANLEEALKRRGGAITRGAKATRLIVEDGRCVGVVAEIDGVEREIRAANVIICDGGFQANPELVGKYISAQPGQLCRRNAGTAKGDGLLMAQEAGARSVGLDRFYGHVLSADAFTSDDFWPFPILDFLCMAGVVVDGAGARVLDEGLGGVRIINQLAKLAEPASTWLVYDQAIWDGPGKEFLTPANPLLKSLGASILEAGTIDALAAKMGVDASALRATIETYNRAVSEGATEGLSPKRTVGAHKPMRVEAAPFYAIRICAGLTYTMGGIAIDADARVLREEGGVIPGLYAAGCATGGIEGGENVAYIGGLTKSTFTGYRSAGSILSSLRG